MMIVLSQASGGSMATDCGIGSYDETPACVARDSRFATLAKRVLFRTLGMGGTTVMVINLVFQGK